MEPRAEQYTNKEKAMPSPPLKRILNRLANEKIEGVSWRRKDTQYIKVHVDTEAWTVVVKVEPQLCLPGNIAPIKEAETPEDLELEVHAISIGGTDFAWFKLAESKKHNLVVYTDLVFEIKRLEK